jgi:O-antigen ligase
MSQIAVLLQFLIVFIGGFNFALPDYRWATPIQVVHGVFVNYALLVIYVLVLFLAGRSRRLATTTTAFGFAMLIVGLGVLGVVSAGINEYALNDVFRALKLFVLAAYFLLAVHWSRSRGTTFFLRTYLAGIATAGVINIYFSVLDPYEIVVGSLPVLRSQNGAGGLLALGISLGAWLMISRQTREDAYVAVASSLVGLCAVAISYSKTSMTIGLCGVIAWLFVLTSSVTTRRSRRIAWTSLAVLLIAGAFAAATERGSSRIVLLGRSVQNKFGYLDLNNKYSLGARYMYIWGVWEVLGEHPLFGVGYSGFYDAITHTQLYRAGLMIDEDPEAGARGQSNPHNSFLFYAASNGFPGLMIVLALFMVSLREMWHCLARRGLSGAGIWACLALAYFVYGVTLPTLFDTEVLYLATAVAISQVMRRRAYESEILRAALRAPRSVLASTAAVQPTPSTDGQLA